MNISRRRFAQAVFAAPAISTLGFFPARAGAAPDFRYRFAHGFPLTHPVHAYLKIAADKTLKDTNGALQIDVYGASQLGGDSQMLSQLRSGGIEFFTTAGLILSTFVPVASIYGMGFTFDNYTTVWKAIDGDLGNHIRGAFQKAGLQPFETVWDNGFRQISSAKHPIVKPGDLKGFKIRVPVGSIYTSMFNALGAGPVNLNLGDTYTALQTQLVDGQENPLVVFDTAKFFEVQKYVSLTNHIWDGAWLLAGHDAWAALPKDMQQIVSRNFNAAGLTQRVESEHVNVALQKKLTDLKISVNSVDMSLFRKALTTSGFYKAWQAKYDRQAWALLTKYVGELG
ncbi:MULTISPECIES: TRAP transporter substrate-binding protein [Paraburkholderia]|uniref:TRAP transporter substrate-binding protein n=1 Tax=Paraburkholderia metrosideri TaxID=580937 RepID=A0ABW9E6G1_9BURK